MTAKEAEAPPEFGILDRAFIKKLWDEARTARLSELYYGRRITHLTSASFWSDMAIAVAASGSGIAGWTVWQYQTGKVIWAVIAGIAALLAVAKPLLNLNSKIAAATKQQQVYRGILSSLEFLAFDIEQASTIKPEHRARLQRTRDMLMQAQNADDSEPSKPLLEKLWARVNTEMPVSSLWFPPKTNKGFVAAK